MSKKVSNNELINAEREKVILYGGIGDKNSNNNTQWYQQNRIYDADGIALCISSAFNPWYKVSEEDGKRKNKETNT